MSRSYTPRPRGTVQQRFEAKYTPEPNTGCWLWTAAINATGYGIMAVPGRSTQLAHRIAWELFRSPIPDGLVIDHLCRVRCCVNPDHFRLVPPAINSVENSLSVSARNAAKQRCPRCDGSFESREEGGRVVRRCMACYRASHRRNRDPAMWERIQPALAVIDVTRRN